MHGSVQCVIITERGANGERQVDRKPLGIRFHECFYKPLCHTNRGLTVDALMKILEKIRELINTVIYPDVRPEEAMLKIRQKLFFKQLFLLIENL